MAAGRQARPDEFGMAGRNATDPASCPFCPGHEDRTTAEILATGRSGDAAADRSSWRIRVFSNMYPALAPEPTGQPAGDQDGLFPEEPGLGGHEVVAYTPEHEGSLGSLTVEHLGELLQVIRDRVIDLEQSVPGVRHVFPFCNHGAYAGATLAHPHLQILAAPLIPALLREKAANLADYRARTGQCLICKTIEAELRDGRRIIAENSGWVGLAPWASRFPYELRFFPRGHEARLNNATRANLDALAQVLKSGLARLESIHQNSSYNLIIHSGACRGDGTPGGDASASPAFHWHVEVLPRLTRLAGFEAGTGYAINSITPEEAAARLRGKG